MWEERVSSFVNKLLTTEGLYNESLRYLDECEDIVGDLITPGMKDNIIEIINGIIETNYKKNGNILTNTLYPPSIDFFFKYYIKREYVKSKRDSIKNKDHIIDGINRLEFYYQTGKLKRPIRNILKEIQWNLPDFISDLLTEDGLYYTTVRYLKENKIMDNINLDNLRTAIEDFVKENHGPFVKQIEG